jgi:alanyl-tRNA synthetase
LAAGHKRIVAVTGPKAIELFQHCFDTVKTLSQEFKVKREDVLDAIDKNQEQIRQLQADLKKFKKQHLQSQIAMWLAATELVQGVPFLFLMLDDLSNQELKEITTQLQAKRPGLYFVATTIADKQIFFCSVAADFAQKIDMRNFANWLKDTHNLRGGTTPCTVQGGGTFTSDLKDQIKGWLTKMKAIS